MGRPNSTITKMRDKRLARCEQAVALRIQGLGFREIAKAMRISLSVAHGYVQDGLGYARERAADAGDVLIQLELEKLDQAERVVAARLFALTENTGGFFGKAGQVIDTDAADVRALVDSMIKISTRRAKLCGFDAPDKVEIVEPDLGGALAFSAMLLAGAGKGGEGDKKA